MPKSTSENDARKLERDPRTELGLKSPAEELSEANEDTSARKATQFDGNPSPKGAQSDTFKPKDDTPLYLKKTEGVRDDQKADTQFGKTDPDSTETPQEQNRPKDQSK